MPRVQWAAAIREHHKRGGRTEACVILKNPSALQIAIVPQNDSFRGRHALEADSKASFDNFETSGSTPAPVFAEMKVPGRNPEIEMVLDVLLEIVLLLVVRRVPLVHHYDHRAPPSCA